MLEAPDDAGPRVGIELEGLPAVDDPEAGIWELPRSEDQRQTVVISGEYAGGCANEHMDDNGIGQ